MPIYEDEIVKFFLDAFLVEDPDGEVEFDELIDNTEIATGLASAEELVVKYLYEKKAVIEEGKVYGFEFLF
jgi:hypothetical protein